MAKFATIYDLADEAILKGPTLGEPGQKLRLLYQHSVCHPGLKWAVLRWCRHPQVPRPAWSRYQQMLRTAMASDYRQWQQADWLAETFAPLAELLDLVPPPNFRQPRQPQADLAQPPTEDELKRGQDTVWRDIWRVWEREPQQPWFPVAAQCVLTGDDHLDGKSFLNVLQGLGSIEYQQAVICLSLARCFINANPWAMRFVRPRYAGVSEPMFQRVGWIWHRTAYYDAIFFDQLFTFLQKGKSSELQRTRTQTILENLVRFNVVTSQESLVSPESGRRHPAITCLPKDEQGRPQCHMSASDWNRKAKLGFADFVPDVDTTFLTLSMADKWSARAASPELQGQCEKLLAHPWPEIIGEYQVGYGRGTNPPTIKMSKPLDYHGAVPIWFDKPFPQPDGRVIREALGNEVCPGHNMDILESLLVNRKRWNSLSGERLNVVQRLLDFQYRAFTSGNALQESAYVYYLPEMNLFYAGRVYAAYLELSPEERGLLDPELKIEAIREIALHQAREEILGQTFNVFDAALAVTALALLQDDEPGHHAMARGVRLILQAAGEGPKGHPYRAYEWNKMRHPTRILVGSEVSTSLFVLQALTEARHFWFGPKNGAGQPARQRSTVDCVAQPVA